MATLSTGSGLRFLGLKWSDSASPLKPEMHCNYTLNPAL